MSNVNLGDLIKALRCLASNTPEGDCFEERFNFGNDGTKISCYGSAETLKCPYHQNTYDVCFEDGNCSEWLEDIAKLLEELQQYRELGAVDELAEIQNILLRDAPCLREYKKIGSPEECREAREKQIPVLAARGKAYSQVCPKCGYPVRWLFCENCGQAIRYGYIEEENDGEIN